MEQRIKLHVEVILGFYDTMQLFLASGQNDELYMCVLHSVNPDGSSKYLGVKTGLFDYEDYIHGNIDLRSLYTKEDADLYDVTGDEDGIFATKRNEPATEDMLPEKGYYNEWKRILEQCACTGIDSGNAGNTGERKGWLDIGHDS